VNRKKDWLNIVFLIGTPLVGVFGTAWWTLAHGFHWWQPALTLALCVIVGTGIGAGYHRLFSHRSYEAHPFVESVLLTLGAMALQNSALTWVRDHRDHHRFTDTDRDPYSVTKGFWWAHMTWIFYKHPVDRGYDNVPDLLKNPRVMFQHRWSHKLGFVLSLAVPTAIGALLGDAIAGMLWGGFLRIAMVHHSTFFVNSAAHIWGKPAYDANATAKDSQVVALFTNGEGWHSFHHRFPSDFRNGLHWWQYDPNKWLIQTFHKLGVARSLNRTPTHIIDAARAKASAALDEMKAKTSVSASAIASPLEDAESPAVAGG
jgi:stearoyl-CoA desaturase (delta-9 desaturase)